MCITWQTHTELATLALAALAADNAAEYNTVTQKLLANKHTLLTLANTNVSFLFVWRFFSTLFPPLTSNMYISNSFLLLNTSNSFCKFRTDSECVVYFYLSVI